MQTQAILLAALASASTLAAAQSPATPTPSNPASAGPSFSLSDDIPNPEGYGDAYSLDEIRFGGKSYTEEQQVARWQAELAAGRARAGVLAGAYAAYRALTPTDCDAARASLTKADELGSDQAAWQLAQLAGNSTCGELDRAQLERWLKKAVTLDYPRAAEDLIIFYRNGTEPDAKVQQYTYARVAAGYWEANKVTVPREGFDAAALQEMEKTITPADRTRAESEAANILAAMLKRHQRFGTVQPVEFARGDAGARTSYVGYSLDYRHECQWNLKNNCRGAQRLAYAEVTNKNSEFVSCNLEMRARDFVNGTLDAEPARRQVLIGPQATRKLLLTDVNDNPDKKALAATCKPVPKLAANLAAGKCRAKLQGSIDVERFYPESAKARGTEGSTVVRYWVPPGSDVPTDAEIVTSSGDATLDDAAIATIRSGKFASDCDYGLSSIRIAFKLQN
jgi:TonB family protein